MLLSLYVPRFSTYSESVCEPKPVRRTAGAADVGGAPPGGARGRGLLVALEED